MLSVWCRLAKGNRTTWALLIAVPPFAVPAARKGVNQSRTTQRLANDGTVNSVNRNTTRKDQNNTLGIMLEIFMALPFLLTKHLAV